MKPFWLGRRMRAPVKSTAHRLGEFPKKGASGGGYDLKKGEARGEVKWEQPKKCTNKSFRRGVTKGLQCYRESSQEETIGRDAGIRQGDPENRSEEEGKKVKVDPYEQKTRKKYTLKDR